MLAEALEKFVVPEGNLKRLVDLFQQKFYVGVSL
jgi:hypothetical protein